MNGVWGGKLWGTRQIPNENNARHSQAFPLRNAFLAFECLGMPGIPQALLPGMNSFPLRNVIGGADFRNPGMTFLPGMPNIPGGNVIGGADFRNPGMTFLPGMPNIPGGNVHWNEHS